MSGSTQGRGPQVRHRERPAAQQPATPPPPGPQARARATQRDRVQAQLATSNPFDLGEIYRPHEVLPQELAERARHVNAWGTDYTQEFILTTLHQLLLARVPLDQIAHRFGVTTRTVQRWRHQLHTMVAKEAKTLDPYPLVGEAMAHYRQVRAAGWQIYMGSRTAGDKKAGLELALKADGEMLKLLQASGFFSRNLLREGMDDVAANSSDSAEKGGVAGLHHMMTEYMTDRKRAFGQLEAGDVIVDEPVNEDDMLPGGIDDTDYGPRLF